MQGSHRACGTGSDRLVFEKMFKVGATFDDRSGSLLKVRLYSFQERSSDPHPSALFQGSFVRNIPKLRVLFQDGVDLISEAHVSVSQLALDP